jgi:DNA polymerase III epsilon subunit-like protein
MGLSLIVADSETTSLDYNVGHVIEIALLNVSNGESKNWFLKPMDEKGIEPKALEVNGAKLEDLLWQTQTGKDKYKDPVETLPEIENWLNDVCGANIYNRVLVGHNIQFDYNYFKGLWGRCDAMDTFPFSQYGNFIDTKSLTLLHDFLHEEQSIYYNLGACVKKFGISKKFDYHGAASDVNATKLLFDELCKNLKA